MNNKYIDIDFAKLDIDRLKRRGSSETVFSKGKTNEQLAKIFLEFKNVGQNVLATKTSAEQAQYVKKIIKEVQYDFEAKTLTLVQNEIKKVGQIAVCTAGSTDIPIAKEAINCAEFFGSNVEKFFDIGIAGLHRLLDKIDEIRKANVIIAIAGMEGTLPSVITGLVDKPVIAVPTSIGYGASFNGVSALLAMLNSCCEGMSVVNIDNGFGAGYSANLINQLISRGEK